MGLFIVGFISGMLLWLWGRSAEKAEERRRQQEYDAMPTRPPPKVRTYEECLADVEEKMREVGML